MKKIIVTGFVSDDGHQATTPFQIHERKAIGKPSSVRKTTDHLVATILVKGALPKNIVVRKHTTKLKRTIRLAIGKKFINKTGQRFVRILMWVKSMIIGAAGELKEIRHKFRLNYPIPSTPATA
jgi:hypothetical protein